MQLQELLDNLLQVHSPKGSSAKRARSAANALVAALGNIPVETGAPTELDVGSRVCIPGSRDGWVVFWSYEDGTLDVIKEGGLSSGDILYGWTPGQSMKEYKKELKKEYAEWETSDTARRRAADAKSRRARLVVPLRGIRRGEVAGRDDLSSGGIGKAKDGRTTARKSSTGRHVSVSDEPDARAGTHTG